MVGPVKSGTITDTTPVVLGSAAGSRVSSWLIHFEETSTITGAVTIAGKASDRSAGAYTLLALGYKDMETSAVATSTITGDRLVLVDSSGTDVVLNTTISGGTLSYTAIPLVG